MEINEGVVESYVENVPIVLLFVCAVIVSPIFEELLFRKILLEKLLPYGKVIAIAISSLFFGLYHANLEQLLYTMFFTFFILLYSQTAQNVAHSVS